MKGVVLGQVINHVCISRTRSCLTLINHEPAKERAVFTGMEKLRTDEGLCFASPSKRCDPVGRDSTNAADVLFLFCAS